MRIFSCDAASVPKIEIGPTFQPKTASIKKSLLILTPPKKGGTTQRGRQDASCASGHMLIKKIKKNKSASTSQMIFNPLIGQKQKHGFENHQTVTIATECGNRSWPNRPTPLRWNLRWEIKWQNQSSTKRKPSSFMVIAGRERGNNNFN